MLSDDAMTRWWLLVALGLASCGPSNLSQTALKGELSELRRAIDAAKAKGELSDEARELAHAVARRELMASTGDAAVARVRELRTCVGALRSDLEERAEQTDAGAAAAALALLEAGFGDGDEWLEVYSESSDPNFRAVAARSAVGSDAGDFRRASFVHGDLRVRRAALRAALEQPQPADRREALEAARLDPDPLVRSFAVRLLGEIGGEESVRALRDVWERAETETRQVIVEAWASAPSRSHGGEAQLLWAMETQKGLPAIVAAARLASSDNPHREPAIAVLRRAIEHGPVDEQRLAVLLAPKNPALEPAIAGLAASEDAHAAVLAAAAQGRHPATADRARQRLRELANHEQARIARQARAALVVMGEQSIAPLLKREMQSKASERRRQAALDLLRLGMLSEAAVALGDPVASVRTQTACAILSSR